MYKIALKMQGALLYITTVFVGLSPGIAKQGNSIYFDELPTCPAEEQMGLRFNSILSKIYFPKRQP